MTRAPPPATGPAEGVIETTWIPWRYSNVRREVVTWRAVLVTSDTATSPAGCGVVVQCSRDALRTVAGDGTEPTMHQSPSATVNGPPVSVSSVPPRSMPLVGVTDATTIVSASNATRSWV